MAYYEDGDSDIDYGNRNAFYDGSGNQPELEFQSFDASETSGVPSPEFGDVEMEEFGNDTENTSNNTPTRAPGEGKFWQLSYYQKIADVDSLEVGKRIGSSVFPLKDFFQLISGNPDLYGWFWIATTLIFAVAAAGNFASYLTYAINDQVDAWSFDFAKLGAGATLIYLYVTIIPFLAFVAMKLWLELEPGLLDHFCLYGYSLVPYIPASVLMIIPIGYVRWVIMILACALVCAFLIRNYFPVIRSKPLEGGITLLVLVVINILFALLLQFFFFEYGVERPSSDSSDDSSVISSLESSAQTSDSEDTVTVSPTMVPTPSVTASPEPTPSVSISPVIDSPSASSSVFPTPSPSPPASPTPTPIPNIGD